MIRALRRCLLLLPLLGLALLAQAAHRDPAPLDLQAMQHMLKERMPARDRMHEVAQRQVQEVKQLLQELEADEAANRGHAAATKQAQFGAKRIEMETLRQEFRTRLTASKNQLQGLAMRDKVSAMSDFENKLEARFKQALEALQEVEGAGNRRAMRSAMARAKTLFDGFARAATDEPDAGAVAPVWRQEQPLAPQPQPAADQVPRHVADLQWAMQRLAERFNNMICEKSHFIYWQIDPARIAESLGSRAQHFLDGGGRYALPILLALLAVVLFRRFIPANQESCIVL